jgi:hypothetical protein
MYARPRMRGREPAAALTNPPPHAGEGRVGANSHAGASAEEIVHA